MNEEQLDAIKSLNNTLLIAGAGSGKTTTIINKIDYLISNKYYKSEDILVISFTNASVLDIKKKLKVNVDVFTFHKLALNIIGKNTSIVSDNYLEYIINEYLNGYCLNNTKAKKVLSRVLLLDRMDNIKKTIYTFISLYKSQYKDIFYLFDIYNKSIFLKKDYLKLILDVLLIYQRELESTFSYDFNDLITYSTYLIERDIKKLRYKFIIIDEFQDTSLIRLKLILAIIKKNNAKIFVVGDDYQSIYRFSGCDLNVFLNINNYIKDIEIKKLRYNYRNNSETINIANKFIMKNKKQFFKDVICIKNLLRPIVIVYYKDKNKIFNNFINDYPNLKFLVLGRNNIDKDNFKIVENENIKFLTVHKSKGLEEDNVIILNLENSIMGFPSKLINNNIIKYVTPKDYIAYEEERRLFYVALTRSRNFTFLFTPINKESCFVKEIIKDNKKDITIINKYVKIR